MKKIVFIVNIVFMTVFLSSYTVSASQWQTLDTGLFLGEFSPPKKPEAKITIVKIDPKYYSLKLLCSAEHDKQSLTLKQWAKKYDLVAAVNAGMYAKDYITHVGYMKNYKHINNPRLRKDYKTVLAFNPVDKKVPEVQLLDLECHNFKKLKNKYNTLIQNIRMISCKQRNVWTRQKEKWSIVALGMDKSGKVLFIFSQSRYSVQDFINILLKLPLSIYTAMYLEGGSQSGLYLSTGEIEINQYGYLDKDSENKFAIPHSLPNVIGIVKKSK